MRLEQFTDRQLVNLEQVTRGTIIDLDEEVNETPDLALAFDLMDQLQVPLSLAAKIDQEFHRRDNRRRKAHLRTFAASVVGSGKNLHQWSENLLSEIESLRNDFKHAPVPGERQFK